MLATVLTSGILAYNINVQSMEFFYHLEGSITYSY